MTNCGRKRGTEGTVKSVPVTKRARTTPTSIGGSEDLAYLRREHEELRRQLQSRVGDISNERDDKDCVLTILDGETPGLNIYDSAKENDKRTLEIKLESCLCQLNDRDLQIVTLENSAIAAVQVRLELENRVAKMQQQLCKQLEEGGSYADGTATPFLFESTLKAIQLSASSFTKVFLAYAKSESIDANRALTKHFESPFPTRPAHVTYLLRAWTFEAFFLDFENESFSCGGTSIFLDHTERRVKCFEYFQLLDSNADVFNLCAEDRFEEFRRLKLREFLSLWQSEPDQVTAGKLSSDALEDSGAAEPNVQLMESFRSVAKGVWALHKLSLSFPTRAEIFRVSHHSEISAEYMESVVSREDDRRFVSKGPIDTESHLSRLPQTDLSDIKLGKALHLVSRNLAIAVTGEEILTVFGESSFCSNGNEDPVPNSSNTSEEVSDILGLHDICKVPQSTCSHVQDNLSFPAEGQDTAKLIGNLTRERDCVEGRLNANSKGTLKLYEDLISLLQRWEDKFREQKGLVFEKEKEVEFLKKEKESAIAILKGENQQFREVITELRPRVRQVLELKSTIFGMKSEIAQLRLVVNSQQSFRDELLECDIGKTFRQLFCDKSALREDLFKCQTELKSATHVKTSEIKQMEDTMLELAKVNRELEQKVGKIQQKLCKEMAGQHGSYVDGQPTPSLFESTATEMFTSIAAFSALLSKYTGPDGHNPVYTFITGIDLWKKSRVARKHHWTYMLKHFNSYHLFANFESETFVGYDDSVLFLDPEKRVSQCFEYFKSCKNEGAVGRAFCDASNHKLDYLFVRYLAQILLRLLPNELMPIFCGIFNNHNEFTRVRLNDLLSSLAIDKQKLVRSLMQAAEKVWQFHKLCLSFEPPATIFRVSPGETFNQHYMESTDALENADGNSVPTVGFMVYPGFRLRKSIIKCEIYVAIST